MEANRDPDQTRNIFRMVALAAGLWFLGSGIWGLLTETPADRAVSGCEAAAREQAADPATSVEHTLVREEHALGWFVAGEVRQNVDNVVSVVYVWECVANLEGRNPAITVWNPVG